ncbi:MAG: energy transducer TonB [Bacteroidales bacterium]|nr:energy transducer TonB [Candidatus Cacconaster scatequi]
MEIKKTPKADLENKKALFMEIGLAVVLLVVLVAFEWSSSEKQEVMDLTGQQQVIEEEIIPITQEQQQAPPEMPKTPVLSDIIDIVDDDVEVADDLFVNTEDDASLGVEIMEYHTEVVEEEVEEEAIPFAFVEEKPKFQGGDANTFSKWVNSKLVYPEIAKENGIQGRVTLQFTVNTDGSVSNVIVLRGVDSSLDKEAVRIVSQSPKWTPGRQRERPVKVTYTFPVIFRLQ